MSVAADPLGWRPVFFSEVAPFASAVLAHHYPHVPNLGDMLKIKGSDHADKITVLAGGTPCQSFSTAGLRKGLADPRGGLMLAFTRLAL
jgi:Site-specific DNA methylase